MAKNKLRLAGLLTGTLTLAAVLIGAGTNPTTRGGPPPFSIVPANPIILDREGHRQIVLNVQSVPGEIVRHVWTIPAEGGIKCREIVASTFSLEVPGNSQMGVEVQNGMSLWIESQSGVPMFGRPLDNDDQRSQSFSSPLVLEEGDTVSFSVLGDSPTSGQVRLLLLGEPVAPTTRVKEWKE